MKPIFRDTYVITGLYYHITNIMWFFYALPVPLHPGPAASGFNVFPVQVTSPRDSICFICVFPLTSV